MQECEICGKTGNLISSLVEGVTLKVCPGCLRFGRVLETSEEFPKIKHQKAKNKKDVFGEETIIIAPNYFKKVKSAREKKGMTQEELGKAISEKESLIHNIEAGKFEPPTEITRKLENFLGINITEEYKEQEIIKQIITTEPLTIGDLLKKKNEKT